MQGLTGPLKIWALLTVGTQPARGPAPAACLKVLQTCKAAGGSPLPSLSSQGQRAQPPGDLRGLSNSVATADQHSSMMVPSVWKARGGAYLGEALLGGQEGQHAEARTRAGVHKALPTGLVGCCQAGSQAHARHGRGTLLQLPSNSMALCLQPATELGVLAHKCASKEATFHLAVTDSLQT